MAVWDVYNGTTATAAAATMAMNQDNTGRLTSVAGFDLLGHSQSVAVAVDEAYWGVNPTAHNPAYPGPWLLFSWACRTLGFGQSVYFNRHTVGTDPNVLTIGYTRVGAGSAVPWHTDLTWDPVNHKHWRFKEAGGTLTWDVSPDGVTWTTLHSMSSAGATLTNGEFDLQAGGNSTAGDPPKYAVWSHMRGLINDWLNDPSALLDQFSGATLDTAVWVDQAGTAQTGGQLRMPVNASGGRILTVAPYDITNGFVAIRVVSWGELPGISNSSGRLPCVWISSVAYGDDFAGPWPWTACKAQFWADWPGGSLSLTPVYSVDDGSVPGSLNPVQTSLSGATEIVDFVAHAYLRIRHSTATGLIYWERSADGVTWTIMASITKPVDWQLNRVMVELSEHTPSL